MAPKSSVGDREAEHAVAEEGEAPVGVGAVLDPGGVGEGLPAQLFGGVREQLRQRGGGCHRSGLHSPPSRAGARAQTKSTASPTVLISAASSSLTRIP